MFLNTLHKMLKPCDKLVTILQGCSVARLSQPRNFPMGSPGRLNVLGRHMHDLPMLKHQLRKWI